MMDSGIRGGADIARVLAMVLILHFWVDHLCMEFLL